MSSAYDELIDRLRTVARIASAGTLLGWDQETKMPPKAAGARAESLATLARLAHERATDARIGACLDAAEADPELVADDRIAANLREIRRDYERARKLPADFVAEVNEVNSRAMEAWKKARAESDFETFRPWLERQIELNRRKADYYGFPDGGERYDALLDDFEPGLSGTAVEALFKPLRQELTPLIAQIAASPKHPDDDVQGLTIPLEQQIALNTRVVEQLGFDRGAGRLDVSTHPFSSGIAPGDTRITTRYRDDQFTDALSSTIHEAGHALYEQGLPRDEHWGEPLGESLGLAIHESQSRLWENHVGRSLTFWEWALPLAQQTLGSALERFSPEDLYRASNIVRPGLIRVESDEATYNLHIMLRFDLERAMLRGDLVVRDLPGAWNERIQQDLGLEVPDDARGCLQDIHWSMGAIGYFPTYTLGSLYAAQFWDAVGGALPDLDAHVRAGEFGPLLGWLRDNIHRHGRRYDADELCRRLTGESLSHAAAIRHLRAKLSPIYDLA